jgi:hypothetical protein
MTYEEWLASVQPRIKAEPIWKAVMYQKAMFLYDLVWEDCGLLMKDARGRKVAEQLIDSAGSISANMEEGHGRGYGKERQYSARGTGFSARVKGLVSTGTPSALCRRLRTAPCFAR